MTLTKKQIEIELAYLIKESQDLVNDGLLSYPFFKNRWIGLLAQMKALRKKHTQLCKQA